MSRKSSPDRAEREEKRQARVKKLRENFSIAYATPEGKRTLRHIMNLCGYQASIVGANPELGMDIEQGTLYNAARRNVYIEIRALVPSSILKEIEFTEGE